jgi:DNA gyrase subunit A
MQESFSMIFLAVHNGQPKELPLDKAIRAFLDHRTEIVRRRTAFLLKKARAREHILEGLKIALDNLQTVVSIIRLSTSRAEARENLRTWSLYGVTDRGWIERHRSESRGWINDTELERLVGFKGNLKFDSKTNFISHFRFGFSYVANEGFVTQLGDGLTYIQIDAILELQLYRLTQLSAKELLDELNLVKANVEEYESILASQAKLRRVIAKELEEIRTKYGDARRTQILDETAELGLEDLIADEQVAVTVSNTGYLKRTPISVYRQQRRGGTGRLGMKTREEDFVAQLIIDSTHAYLLCFTNTGRVYWVKIYEVPDVGAAGKGKAMASLIDLQPGERVVTILPVKDLEEDSKYVLFATRNGTVKKSALVDFSNVMSRGIIAINIEKDDELVCARITDGHQVIFLATHDGLAIRFSEADLRPMGRPATGNRGINLRKGDYVIGAAVTPSNEARNKERLARAKAHGLSAQAEAAIDEAADSAAAQPLELATADDTPAAPAVSEVTAAKLAKLDEKLGLTPCLILSVSENGYGKRTDVDSYRLQARGGKGVISMKTTPKIGKVSAINLVDDTTEMMLISQFGKIIRIDTKTIRSAGRSTSGVKLLNLDTDDKVAAAVVIPPEDPKSQPENGTLLQ